MKFKNKLTAIRTIYAIICTCAGFNCIFSFFTDKILFSVNFIIFGVLIIFSLFYVRLIKKRTTDFLRDISKNINPSSEAALANFPLPAVVTDENNNILWYNLLFKNEILEKHDAFDEDITSVIKDIKTDFLGNSKAFDVFAAKKHFITYGSKTEVKSKIYHSYYFINNTNQKQIVDQYHKSRPSVLLLYVDNLEESFRDLKDSEKVKMLGQIENMLDSFIGTTNGFLRKLDRDRFLAVIEQQHMDEIIEKRFELLDMVRGIETESKMPVTLSIGVGTDGKDMAEDEEYARQALDMALGRGGDQAAVKSHAGYEFYGGVSKGVEKRSKIKTRIMASAIGELIEAADNVIVMGHLAADLDCLASSSIMAKCAKEMGKEAFVAINKNENLATALYEKLSENGYAGIFISPEEAQRQVKPKTLLIITDTHNTRSIQSSQLLTSCDNVIVIDHHRKMINYIEKAIIFYHEPFASSASEMVTELMQYMAPKAVITSMEANALLSGIMLDTKNFLMKTGVRTFEAAAYLRQMGADTTEIKKMFTNTMDVYRLKTSLVSSAEVYKSCAISIYDEDSENITMISAQAADDLLDISGVEASFIIYKRGGMACVSARSMGKINVQIIMEAMGGGGHQTMAGTQIADIDVVIARQKLVVEIDNYYSNAKITPPH